MTEGTPDASETYLEIMTGAGDNYVKADVMLPCGGNLLREQVIKRKLDAGCNSIEKANDNPILDSLHYLVEF